MMTVEGGMPWVEMTGHVAVGEGVARWLRATIMMIMTVFVLMMATKVVVVMMAMTMMMVLTVWAMSVLLRLLATLKWLLLSVLGMSFPVLLILMIVMTSRARMMRVVTRTTVLGRMTAEIPARLGNDGAREEWGWWLAEWSRGRSAEGCRRMRMRKLSRVYFGETTPMIAWPREPGSPLPFGVCALRGSAACPSILIFVVVETECFWPSIFHKTLLVTSNAS